MESTNSTNIPKARRLGDSATCQKIWDAIRHIRNEKKGAFAENIIRFVNKNYNVAEKNVERELRHLVADGLVMEKKAIATKGSQKGNEQTVYAIPNEVNIQTTHDWYCFKCHKAGDVVACTTCPRVYHVDCTDQIGAQWDDFSCKACQNCSNNETPHLEQGEINHILSFVVARLEDSFQFNLYSWNPSLTSAIYATSFSTDRCVTLAHKRQKSNTDTDVNENWRADFLLRIDASLAKMNSRADRQVYKSFEHFRLDARTIVHNVSVFHGEHSPMADTARMLLKKCIKELEEAKLCTDCYRRSNEQEADGWFCEPCDPPHELVFAKAKGYQFWPAKVMNIVGEKYDVRFFGGAHDRAKIDKPYIRPITVDINQLVTKRSTLWKEAMKELEEHQKLLAELDGDESEDAEANLTEPEASSPGGSVEREKIELKNCSVAVDRNAEIDRIAKVLSASRRRGSSRKSVKSNSKLQSALDQFYRDELRTVMETVDQQRKELAAHAEEIKNLKEENAKVIAERDRAIADARIEAELNKAMKEEHEEKVRSIEKKHEEQIQAMKAEHDCKIRELNQEEFQKCSDELKTLKENHQGQMDAVEKKRKDDTEELENCYKQKLLEMQQEHAEQLKTAEASYEEKLKEVRQDCQREIEANKKKQWCAQCGKEGVYHCCLGVSYCHKDCQLEHWSTTHKRSCLRKKERQEQRKDLVN